MAAGIIEPISAWWVIVTFPVALWDLSLGRAKWPETSP